MIEKLKWDEQPEDAAKEVQNLIDQLVDAVNVLQAQVAILQEHAHPTAKTESTETPTISKMENVSFGTGRRIDISYIDDVDNNIDTYAEQRKWIGCVCRFWFDNPDDTVLDYLGKIQTGENGIEYYGKETYDWFPHCEPILQTDSAIYKGGNND